MSEEHRYIQPKNVQEAMTLIQKLFNEYRHAPLTDVLLRYHQNLIDRLQSDIRQAAIQENDKQQLHELDNMVSVMQMWTKIRLNNQPFEGKMKNFKWVTNHRPKFKRHIHKMKGNPERRASRH